MRNRKDLAPYAGVDRRRRPRAKPGFGKPAADAAGPPDIASRHTAITSKLHDWRSYRSWVDKVREDWDGEK